MEAWGNHFGFALTTASRLGSCRPLNVADPAKLCGGRVSKLGAVIGLSHIGRKARRVDLQCDGCSCGYFRDSKNVQGHEWRPVRVCRALFFRVLHGIGYVTDRIYDPICMIRLLTVR